MDDITNMEHEAAMRKLYRESEKLAAETQKLNAETIKLWAEQRYFPTIAIGTMAASLIAGVVALVAMVVKVFF